MRILSTTLRVKTALQVPTILFIEALHLHIMAVCETGAAAAAESAHRAIDRAGHVISAG